MWSFVDYSNYIALATSGGQILVYDVSKETQKSRPISKLTDGNRAVNSLAFNPSAGHVLFSGSGDGSIRGWDLRVNEINKRPSIVFGKSGDSARETQCSPFNAKKLAVIYDSGVIQRWDMRNPKSFDRRLHAHSGVGLCLDWHPDYDYVVSGGRDQQIQIWNMGTEVRNPDCTIFTQSAVAKVRWQIDNASSSSARGAASGVLNTCIASCGRSKGDFSTYIWNPRRPYIPVNVVEEHTDSISDIYWRSDKLIWTSSRDRYFYQHDLATEPLAIDNLTSRAVAWTPSNELSFVVQDKDRDQFGSMSHVKMNSFNDDEGLNSDDSHHSFYSAPHGNSNSAVTNYNTISNSKRSGSSGAMHNNSNPNVGTASTTRRTGSSANKYQPIQEVEFNQAICGAEFSGLELEMFQYFAEKYSVSPSKGETLSELCQRNSDVAAQAGKYRTSQIWKIFQSSIGKDTERFEEYKKERKETESKLTFAAQQHQHQSHHGMISRAVSSTGLQGLNQMHGPITSKIAESLKNNSNANSPNLAPREHAPSSPFSKTTTSFNYVRAEEAGNNNNMKEEENESRQNDSDNESTSSSAASPVPVPETHRRRTQHSRGSEEREEDNYGSDENEGDGANAVMGSSYDTSGSSVGMAFGSFEEKGQTSKSRTTSNNYTQLPMVQPKSYSSNTTNDSGLTDKNGVAMSWTRIAHNDGQQDQTKAKPPPQDLPIISDHSQSDDLQSFGLGIQKWDQDKLNPQQESAEEKEEQEALRQQLIYREYLDTLTQPWRTEKLIEKATEFALEQGDVQFCAVVGTIFLDIYSKAFPSKTVVEEWVHSYIQLLKRCGLFKAAAEVSKVSKFESVKDLSLTETTLETLCHRCMSSLIEVNAMGENSGYYYCDRCRKLLDGCSLCWEPAKGLALWVIECGHKIHISCMKEWVFEQGMLECPSGCGTVLMKDI